MTSVISSYSVALRLHLMGSLAAGMVGHVAVARGPTVNGTAWEDQVAKEDRGFASMDRAKQRDIASKGGKAAHQKGTAHEWTSEEARDAGRKGGLASHKRRREQMMTGNAGAAADSGSMSDDRTEQFDAASEPSTNRE